jgi:hypothetical protein
MNIFLRQRIETVAYGLDLRMWSVIFTVTETVAYGLDFQSVEGRG